MNLAFGLTSCSGSGSVVPSGSVVIDNSSLLQAGKSKSEIREGLIGSGS